jgi:glycosyltransferase involved in cell wall biosynthesis
MGSGIAAAMICKNEERCIARCVTSVIDIVDEFVIVDTGSTDSTVNIIASLQAEYGEKIRLYHFDWIDDFSAARNFSLDQVTKPWVLVVDADDVIADSEHAKIRSMVDDFERQSRKALCYIIYDNTRNRQIVFSAELAYIRLFPSELRYKDMIHETLDYDPASGIMEIIETDIHILHDGYDANVVNSKDKSIRNLQLLQKNLRVDPDNARLWLQLGREMRAYDTEKALRYLDIALSKTTNPQILNWVERTKQAINELK